MTSDGGDDRSIGRTLKRLRRIGLGERMLKTAFAASLAYWLGLHLPYVQSPYLAPIAAILVMQLTIADSVVSAAQRLFGVVVGAPLALVVASRFGVNPLTVALVVLVSFAIGSRLSLNAQGLPQVAITALLVMLVGSPHLGYAVTRIAETAIGGAVGIVVNALVAPPSYLPRAVARVSAFGEALASELDRLGADIDGGLTGAAAEARLDALRAIAGGEDATAAVAQAEASLRYNYFRRGAQEGIERWSALSRTLVHTERQARSIARTMRDLATSAAGLPDWLRPGGGVAAAMRANAGLIRATIALAGAPNDLSIAAAFRDAIAVARARQADLAHVGATERDVDGVPSWLALGATLAGLERMVDDLGAFADGVQSAARRDRGGAADATEGL